jgi:hypothetical protein
MRSLHFITAWSLSNQAMIGFLAGGRVPGWSWFVTQPLHCSGCFLRHPALGFKKESLGMKTAFKTTALRSLDVKSEAWRDRCRSTATRLRASDPAAAIVIAVNVDLGSHDGLFIRGSGGGLRWDKGEALTCVNQRTWVWSTHVKEKLEFRLLLNDEVWERGEIHVLEEGNTIAVTPDFEWPEIPRVASPPSQSRIE